MLWAQAAKPQQPSTTTANKNPKPNPRGRSSNQVAMPANPTISGKSAQKPQFCARNAQKRGFRSQKAHKNLDFVRETPENKGYEGQKSTKTSILCSKALKTGVTKAKSAQKYRFCARKDRDWHREAQPLPSSKSPRTPLKYKYLTTRQLTFRAVLGEHKSKPPSTRMCPRGA